MQCTNGLSKVATSGRTRQSRSEVADFIKQNHVAQTVTYDRILGCSHEEGTDYPEGGSLPVLPPFWENIDRFTHKPKTAFTDMPNIGRNDPCPCGSGKKYKKCCGK